MKEPDKSTKEDEVDDGTEQTLGTENTSMHAQVKQCDVKMYNGVFCQINIAKIE